MLIKILEENPQERGRIFEKMVSDLLREMKYEIDPNSINISSSGYEIDFIAKHEELWIIGECKAHSSHNKIEPKDILTFFGKYILERKKYEGTQEFVAGRFFSLSELTGHADTTYEKIRENPENKFTIFKPEDIVARLNNTLLLQISEDKMKEKMDDQKEIISKITGKSYKLDFCYLAYFAGEYFWIQIISSYPKRFFVIVDSSGNIREESYLYNEFVSRDDWLRDNTIEPFPLELRVGIDAFFKTISVLDKRQVWESIFFKTISLLREKGNYKTIMEVFEEIDRLTSDKDENILEREILSQKEKVTSQILDYTNELVKYGEYDEGLFKDGVETGLYLAAISAETQVRLGNFDMAAENFARAAELAIYLWEVNKAKDYCSYAKKYYSETDKLKSAAECYERIGKVAIPNYIKLLSIMKTKEETEDRILPKIEKGAKLPEVISIKGYDVTEEEVSKSLESAAIEFLWKARDIYRELKETEKIEEMDKTIRELQNRN